MKTKLYLTTIITICLLFMATGIAFAALGFQNDVRIDRAPSGTSSTSPKVCSDNSGHVYVVWVDARGGIYFNRSNDYGQNWLANDIFIALVASPASLKIGCDNTGHVYVSWLQGTSVMLARSSNYGAGGSWSSSGIAGPVSEGFDFAHSQNGHLVVVWNTDSSHILYANYSTNYGAGWSSVKRLDTAPGHSGGDIHASPRVTVDNAGHVYAVWVDNRGAQGPYPGVERFIYFNRSNDFGNNWQSEFAISQTDNGYVGQVPQVVCDNNGHVYSAWLKTTRQQPNVLYLNKSDNYGQNWTGVQYIDWRLDNHQLKVSDNGNVYLAWNDTHDQWIKIKFKSSLDNGVTWQPMARVTNDPTNCQIGNFDFATKGNSVYLAWENLEPWEGIYFNFSKDGGVAWQNR
ncbi:MAG: exo-alpha-sialidase, partial [Candidatus Omnitrophica bacterium]|nr:exo-alpha-sialidase [Candidatus Omnitrophota bacterium]